MSSGCTYDAVSILGFGDPSAEALPQAGEIILRYGGWSLQELRDSAIGKKLMHRQDWYSKFPWGSEKLPPGTYRLRLPIPDSNRKSFAEQEQMLSEGEQIAPVVLVASALLAHQVQADSDLLRGNWTRCREQTTAGDCVALGWGVHWLYVRKEWGHIRSDCVWSSSVRTS